MEEGKKTVPQIAEILLSGDAEDQAEDLEWINCLLLMLHFVLFAEFVCALGIFVTLQ